MKLVFTISLFFLKLSCVLAQNIDSVSNIDLFGDDFGYKEQQFSFTTNESWAKNSKTLTFENQKRMSSTYLAINNDFSFVLLSIYEVGMHLTIGTWYKSNDSTFCFNWDKESSIKLCKNRKVTKKYFKYSYPYPIRIINWVFMKRENLLIPVLSKKID